MSFQLPTQRRARFTQPSWSGVAFLVEAMLLLVFLIASLAVFTQLFGQAIDRGTRSETLSEAVAAVSNGAEAFAADPQSAQGAYQVGDLVVVCDVTPEERPGGTLYHASISAYPAPPDELGSSEVDVVAADSADAAAAPEAAAGALVPTGAEPLYSVETSRYESEVS